MPYSAPGPFLGAQSTSTAYQVSRSLRFRNSVTSYLQRTPASASNRTTWTWSGWVKRGTIGGANNQVLFSCYISSTDVMIIQIRSSDDFDFQGNSSGIISRKISTAVLRDPSAWYHLVAVCDTNNATSDDRARIYINGVRVTNFSTSTNPTSGTNYAVNSTTAHTIGQSNSISYFDGYLAEVNFIDGQALTPSSFGQSNALTGVWEPKQYTGTYGTNGFYLPFTDNTGTSANDLTYSQDLTNAIWTKSAGTASGDVTTAPDGSTTADKFTENTTNAAHFYYTYFATGYQSVNVTYSLYVKAAGRSYALIELVTAAATLYALVDLVAGTISSATSTGADFTNPSSSITSVGNGWYRISISATKGSANTNIYPEFFLCQDSSYTASYTGDGTSGMYIWGQQLQKSLSAGYYRATTSAALTSASNLGADQSNGASSWNFWTPNNISTSSGTTYDSMIDSPTNYADGGNGRGNYAVLNPLDVNVSNTQRPTDGNLTYPVSGAFQYSARSTIFVTSGKWYAEFTISSSAAIVAVVNSSALLYGYTAANGIFTSTTSIFNNGTQVQSGLTAFSANDVIGVAFDADANTVQFYRNGSTYGTAVTISAFSGPYTFQTGANGAVCTIDANFGQRPFVYSNYGTDRPAATFLALNTQNLPAPALTPSP